MRRFCLFVVLLVAAACTRPRPEVVTAPPLDVQPRLDAADALVRAGCFDCLEEALRSYNELRVLPNIPPASGEAALIGSVRAELLLDLRQRELGMVDRGYLQRARDTLAPREDLKQTFAPLMDDVAMTAWRVQRLDAPPMDPELRRRYVELQRNIPAALEARRSTADADLVSAYLWIAFSCTLGDRASRERASLLGPLEHWREAPIVAYRAATCGSPQREPLTTLLEREPRFLEINFWLGAASVGALQLDAAESLLLKAYEWHDDWPALTAMLANVYVGAEELEPALTFYERTLVLTPGHGDAVVGRVRSLSLLGRHREALEAIDEALGQRDRAFAGDMYYWRAWNEVELGTLDQAWLDIEQASRLWVNSEVAKLAGVIAYRRRDLPLAMKRFAEARRLNADDCETQNYIGIIHAERSEWLPTAETFIPTVTCLERARDGVRKEIERIGTLQTSEDRRARWVARRTAQIDTATRMIATAWFNIAAAYFNLGRREEARPFAERLVDDERFADRARDLLGRLR